MLFVHGKKDFLVPISQGLAKLMPDEGDRRDSCASQMRAISLVEEKIRTCRLRRLWDGRISMRV
jgi:hypothetical protein